MDQKTYDELLARVQNRQTVQHEGRTARNKVQLDWIAKEICGFDPGAPEGDRTVAVVIEQAPPAPPAKDGEETDDDPKEDRRAELEPMKVAELKSILEAHGLSKEGRRDELLERILAAEFPQGEE